MKTKGKVAAKMGCVLCNITSCEEAVQGLGPSQKNPFYSKTKRGKEEFLKELAQDIATHHPEIVRKINRYAQRLSNLKS